MAGHNETGKKGEKLAAEYLAGKGFTVLHRNWRYSRYEVDIIASKKNVLHFIEIKTRRSASFGLPEDNADKKKIRNLAEAAEEFMTQNPGWKLIQFDILSVMLNNNGGAGFYFIEDVYV